MITEILHLFFPLYHYVQSELDSFLAIKLLTKHIWFEKYACFEVNYYIGFFYL